MDTSMSSKENVVYRLHPQKVKLTESDFTARFKVNQEYAVSLKNENLLQNYYLEAGLKSWDNKPEGIHWGWEAPTCQLRGHFLGHWLSAAARIYRQTGDTELKGKADKVVDGLAACQKENGGEWAGSIPEKYLDWIAAGKRIWAPQYTIHKTFMGLIDMYRFAGNKRALEIADKWADWFLRWSGQFTREKMDDILDVETGAMLEAWADLYGITGNAKFRTLMERYDRPRLFDALLRGEDCLSYKHANTTIAEIHGAARAWEVTGIERYRRITEAYWKQAVTERGYFCTGGQTTAEAWAPKQKQASMHSTSNQEHCVVYNMIRLADFLLRWTGEAQYSDYIERNIYNGIFAQQNIKTGMVIYYLPFQTGSKKPWGTPTEDFWCCHGTLLQAHTLYADLTAYENENGVVLSQYVPSVLNWQRSGSNIELALNYERNSSSWKKPANDNIRVEIKADRPVEFTLSFRIPWWTEQKFSLSINGESVSCEIVDGYIRITRVWEKDRINLDFSRHVTLCPTPDRPEMNAFMYGPIALAGLCEDEKTLCTGGRKPEEILRPYNENAWEDVSFYTVGQSANIKFIPLYNVIDEKYTIYFPVSD